MMASPSVIRRAYDFIALFALLHVIALVGVVAYMVSAGTLDAEKARNIVKVVRGELPGDELNQEDGAGAGAVDAAAASAAVPGKGVEANSQTDIEVLRLEAARIQAELDQRLALNNTIMLRVMTERESFQKERDNAKQRQNETLKRKRGQGFKKQLAILESLSPKIAVEHLMAMGNADEAAGLLLEMDTKKAKKIVESARRGDQMQKMQIILQRIAEASPDRSVDLGSD